MKQLLILVLIFACSTVNAQTHTATLEWRPTPNDYYSPKKDTVLLRDTVAMAVPLYQVTDTLPGQFLYSNDRSYVRHGDGFLLVQGFKRVDEKGRLVWADKPQVVGALTKQKKAVRRLLQVL